MKIPFSHIKQNFKNSVEINDLSEKLFQLGHEHEIYNEIFDFEFTPNRGDCLSLRGLLRDLNVFYDVDINKNISEIKFNDLKLNFINNVKDFCPKISFLKVEIDKVPDEYDEELESFFLDLDNKKNNFFTDVSNFISYETGQPTHCYKESTLKDKIILDSLKFDSKFETLIGKIINLKENDLVFFNKDNKIINVAGVMGGKNTACEKDTRSVIIECAYFNPEKIIGKTIKYGVNSDAAYKFERSTDPSSHDYVLRRFLKIIENHANILNVEHLSQNSLSNDERNTINFDQEKINKIIGADISIEKIEISLKKLGFTFNENLICVPRHRYDDIKSINDIAEEVARTYGYDNIEPKPFNIVTKKKPDSINLELNLRNFLINNGFYEVINDPFVLTKFNESIEVDNPLDSNKKYLRTSLKDSLLDNLLYNERRQKDSIKLFEISDIYVSDLEKNKRILGIIASGRVDKNYKDFTKKISKEYLNDIFESNVVCNRPIKFINFSRENINSKSKNPIFFCEIEIDSITKINFESYIQKSAINYFYKPISDFPSSSRDVSFSIKDFRKSEVVQDYIFNFKNELLKEIFIFDYFLNHKTKEIKIGFRFVFQDVNSTITETQVNNIMSVIIKDTTKLDGVCIPGLS